MVVRKEREVQNCWGIEEVGIVRMILWTSKGEIGRWKLIKEEELFFGKDCSVVCVHKMDCEDEGSSIILYKIQNTLY